ncbi:MAG TPA: protein kinase [Thermoanaerobaculia bacterium]
MLGTLGHYDLQEKLGAGGMGIVYRARDAVLHREVAVKVLPDTFSSDPERLARFEREAQLLASLSHPNVGAIHGMEEAGGVRYLVLELVPGETLAERLAKGPLQVPEALEVSRQIAEALEAAHERGIIHRDLKPANVKITPKGRVMVLDFGLAKAFAVPTGAPDLSHSPTVTFEGTRDGVILGTAAYMSPEQARGKSLDERTDVWSFGCVLYETLTGSSPFAGETVSDMLAAILGKEPEWDRLPKETPAVARRLLGRCLRKDRERRLHSIADARIELEEAIAGPVDMEALPAPGRRGGILVAALAGLVVGALGVWLATSGVGREKAKPTTPVRFAVQLPAREAIVTGFNPALALSSDTTRLVYLAQSGAQRMLYMRRLDQLEAKPIPGTENGGVPFFSPDGQWLGFRHGPSRKFKKIALSGGAPLTICETETANGVSWGPDGTIIITPQTPSGVARVSSSGGPLEPLTKLDLSKGERNHRFAEFLPGGKAVLFTVGVADMESYDEARIAVQSLETGARKTLVEGGTCARYSPSGHIVYARGGTLLAVPFDAKRLVVTGPPVPVLSGVFESVNNGSAQFAISADGSLAYIPGPAEGAKRLPVWVDRGGKAEPLALPERPYLHPRISPDGTQLAIEIEGPNHDFYVYEFGRGMLTKMTFDGVSHWPLWTPDGRKLTFRSWRTGFFTMWWMPADRSGPEERLTNVGRMQSPASWSPDVRVVAFTQANDDTGPDVYVLDRTARPEPRPFVRSKFAEGSPRFSPDGRWIAYTSNESGRNEIYAQPYPGPGPKIQISNEGGTDAVWSPPGGELFYRNGDNMMVVAVTTSPTLKASAPKVLWEGHYSHGTSSSCGPPGPTSSNYDVTPDGKRFLMIRDRDQDANPNTIHVVLHWANELARIAPPKKS